MEALDKVPSVVYGSGYYPTPWTRNSDTNPTKWDTEYLMDDYWNGVLKAKDLLKGTSMGLELEDVVRYADTPTLDRIIDFLVEVQELRDKTERNRQDEPFQAEYVSKEDLF